ncbi:hypothetical protein AALO_G00063510 [Alosa alosa]|uniref:Uncharacterized protein n=1 Tax=Alosa alosa TaxID=278164 RepID=A0AAV6H3R5_9TELE|nr:hypothetical protein AALO_G00063510 [Alosa alosa]
MQAGPLELQGGSSWGNRGTVWRRCHHRWRSQSSAQLSPHRRCPLQPRHTWATPGPGVGRVYKTRALPLCAEAAPAVPRSLLICG